MRGHVVHAFWRVAVVKGNHGNIGDDFIPLSLIRENWIFVDLVLVGIGLLSKGRGRHGSCLLMPFKSVV